MRRSLAFVLTLATAASLAIAPSAAEAAPLHVKHPCVGVAVKLYPRHIHPGDALNATAGWSNCGRSVYIGYVFRLTGPCGPTGRSEGHFRLLENTGVVMGRLGFTACKGTYRVTAKAYHDGVLIGRMSRYLRVRP